MSEHGKPNPRVDFGEPIMRASVAAQELGVGVELLEGLVSGKNIRGYKVTTPAGNIRWFIAKSEVARLKAEIDGAR